jgi:hypothetical protein
MGMTKFYAGVAVGYVLGARAGRERYHQLVEAWQKLSNQPPVSRLRQELDAKLAELHDAMPQRSDASGLTPGSSRMPTTPPMPPSPAASPVTSMPGAVPEPLVSEPPIAMAAEPSDLDEPPAGPRSVG